MDDNDKNSPPSDIEISCYRYSLQYFSEGVATYHEVGDPRLWRGKYLRYKRDADSGDWVMISMLNVTTKKIGFWASLVAWTAIDEVLGVRFDCMSGQLKAA